MRALAAAAIVGLLLVSAARASEERPTLAELESEVICPTCQTTLDQSNAPIANRMRVFIRGRIEAGDTKGEIEEALVAEFGRAVLASPPKKGFDLLAWVLPFAGLGLAAVALGVLAWRWSRDRAVGEVPAPPATEPDAEIERRLDDELARFDA
jgi:cytochrome c-type biogenesis protein CcmH